MTRGSEKLRAWRESQDPRLSQERAAALVDVKQGTWSSWELGEKRPELEYILLIVDLTGGTVTVEDWLLSEEDFAERKARRLRKVPDESGEHKPITGTDG